jgi:hypothetical protein
MEYFFDFFLWLILFFCLVVELGAAPVAALLVPLDAVAGAHADPSGNGAVLVELLSVLLLDGERLETSHDFFFLRWFFEFEKITLVGYFFVLLNCKRMKNNCSLRLTDFFFF